MTDLPIEPAHFHVGIIVKDFHEAQDHFSALLGVEWGRVLELDHYEVQLGDGTPLTVPNQMCYSTGEPHLELIKEVPGTPWVCNDYSNLHHMGFWSPDFAAASDHLAATGCPLEMRGRDGDQAPVSFAYHRDPLGVRVEVVDGGLRPTIESFLFRPPR